MNLAEFIDETLSEILKGIQEAQIKDGAVGAEFVAGAGPLTSNLFSGGVAGTFTAVDFDVSVAAETKVDGKAGIRVMSIGAEGSGERKSQETSRVKFSIPLRIEMGDRYKRPKG
jgi:hypothetical protein